MTRGEILAAALRAKQYPQHYGYAWGTGPLAAAGISDIPEMLTEHPGWSDYG